MGIGYMGRFVLSCAPLSVALAKGRRPRPRKIHSSAATRSQRNVDLRSSVALKKSWWRRLHVWFPTRLSGVLAAATLEQAEHLVDWEHLARGYRVEEKATLLEKVPPSELYARTA
ncbi:hypothetical protein C8J57DRAFT_1287051 [Mycena rebaudengoi]|nr:hypothetical protein C8J57DRAFT_1287051 [Mycena rebaudengoi]